MVKMEKSYKSRMTGFCRQDDTFINFCKKTQHAPFMTANLPFFRNGFVGGGAILICLIVGVLFLGGCKPKQTIVEREKVVYLHSDSTVYKDSVVYVPVEAYKDYSRLDDTLILETSLATAKAWNDTNDWMLKGCIKNKQSVIYKYIEVERVVTKDSIVEREVPVPYEVEVIKTHIPTWSWFCLGACIIGLGLVVWRFYRRFFL